MSGSSEVWQVALRSGEIRMMTLDELDSAFDEGTINANTKVLPPGAGEWVRLGQAAGLDEAAAAAPPPPPPPAPVQSYPPISFDPSDVGLHDYDAPQFQNPSRKRNVLIALGGAAILGVIVIAATSGGEPSPLPVTAAANAQVTVRPPNPPPGGQPPPQAQPASNDKQPLSEEQRKALADADKALDAKRKAKASSLPGRGRGPTTRPNEPDPFNKGGDSHDPLNNKL